MSKDMRTVVCALLGGAAGFVLGVCGWLAFFYLVFMLPHGTAFRNMDQGAMLTALTGPLGAIIGAVIGGLLSRSRPKATAPNEVAANTPPNDGLATTPGNSVGGNRPPG